MFRLLPRGLPKDPVYPTDLKELGYFINDVDEIRNIENPKYYFKFFISRSERYNERQRESMNTVIRQIVSERLLHQGMNTLTLPLDTPCTQPHIPILVSANISTASRIIVLFGEPTQDLGIFALRIVNGHGGINAGSAVDFVKYVQSLKTDDGGKHPGIILANCGQLRWNRREGKAMTRVSWDALTRPSAVHDAVVFDPVANTVEHNRDMKEHIAYVLSSVVLVLCKSAKIDVIAISDSARCVSEYLDDAWDVVKDRMESLALVFPYHDQATFRNTEFKTWLRKRARGYIMSESPAGVGIFGPQGGRKAWQWGYGMNVYGLPVEVAEECAFPRHFRWVVDWMQEVAKDAEYENEEIIDLETGEVEEKEEKVEWVGAEYWDTEEGKAQLMGGGTEESAALREEDVGERKAHAEKVDVEQGKAQTERQATDESKTQLERENVKEGYAKIETEDTGGNEKIERTEPEWNTPKVPTLGLDGAADEIDNSVPPERMERLPSYVKTDEGEPEVKLNKEEKAAILQITVVSSPGKGKKTLLDGHTELQDKTKSFDGQ